MAWLKNLRRRWFGGTPVYDGTGGGRRALAWMPSNPGAVAALSLAQDELRAIAADPKAAKAYIRKTSMLDALERAEAIA